MYHQRLRSFQGVSGLPLSASKFAIAGFSYVGPRDRVKCEYCEGQLEEWSKGDDPLYEHQKHYPNCPFILPLSGVINLILQILVQAFLLMKQL